MRRKFRIAGMIGGALLLAIAVGLLLLYQGARYVPEAYLEAIEVDPATLEKASDQMLQKAAALVSDVKKEGQWKALFTAEQINGWLAFDLVRNHPRALPPWMGDPRVAIEPDRILLFCRARRRDFDSVITLTLEPYVPEPNVLALRIRGVRAGIVPVPMARVLRAVSQAAQQSDVRLRWQQADGDPVALLTLPASHDENDRRVQIETLRLGDGEVYLAGKTEPHGGKSRRK